MTAGGLQARRPLAVRDLRYSFEMLLAPLSPGKGSLHRFVGFEVAGWIREAIVQDHHDVGTETDLNVNGDFGTQKMRASVQVRLKSNAIFADIAKGTQAENLVPAAVGKDRPIPSHKLMQAAESCHGLVTGPQKKVIRVTQKNLDVKIPQLVRHHRFHGGLRTDGHEDRRLDDAVRRVQPSTPGVGLRIFGQKLELHISI